MGGGCRQNVGGGEAVKLWLGAMWTRHGGGEGNAAYP